MRLLPVAFLLALLSPSARASDVSGWTSFRCPQTGALLSLGATTYEVRTQCREPDDALASVERRTVTRTIARPRASGHRGGGTGEVETVEDSIEVQVEEWTFDFGRNRFLTRLRFENGRLVRITDGPKGVAEPQ